MRLRDLGAWLIPSLALVAVGVPQIRAPERTGQGTLLASTETGSADGSAAANDSARGSPPTDAGSLDSYDHDACHLLWKFTEVNRVLTSGDREVKIAVTGKDQKGQISLVEDVKTGGDKGQAFECNLTDDRFRNDIQAFPIRFLIASLPDPRDAHGTQDFDTGIEALQAAVADAGYGFDSFYLPWKTPAEAALDRSNDRGFEKEPGLILFKRMCSVDEPCTYHLLLAFVVGETPTAGIRKLQLSSALEQVSHLGAAFPKDSPAKYEAGNKRAELLLLAPYYTGSAFSLVETLQGFDHWVDHKKTGEQPLKVTIISGSAAAVDLMEFAPLGDSKAMQFDNLPFRATEGYNPEMRDAFVSGYLSETLDAKPEEIAILRESGTAYGENNKSKGTLGGFIRFLQDLSEHKDKEGSADAFALLPLVRTATNQIANNSNSAKGDAKTKATRDYYDLLQGNLGLLAIGDDAGLRDRYHKSLTYLDMPFPLHISELRGAQQARLTLQPVSLGFGAQPFFPALAPGTEGHDSIPQFSETERASADRVMANLLKTLSIEDYRYVGIYATEPQDIIYLAQQVRHHCPDTLLFTFGSNLLFENPDVVNDLRGMLVVGTYPLVTFNQHWTYPWKGKEKHHQFASESSAGTYNAVMALLGKPDQMTDYEVPLEPPSDGKPSTWVMAVGKQALQPITLLPQTHGWSDAYAYASPKTSYGDDPTIDADLSTRSWAVALVFWSATIFCVWFAWFSMVPAFERGRGVIWRSRFRESGSRRTLALESFLLSLLLAYVLISTLVMAGIFTTCEHCKPIIAIRNTELAGIFSLVTLGTLLLLAASPVFQLVRLSVGGLREGFKAIGQRRWPGIAAIPETVSALSALAVPIVGVVLSFYYITSFDAEPGSSENARAVFSALRYQTPGNGVSPFPPLFFAAITVVLWAASCVRRTGMLESMRGGTDYDDAAPQNSESYLGFDSPSLKDLPRREAHIRSLLWRGALRLPFRFPLLIFLAATFLYAFGRMSSSVIVRSVEGVDFDHLFGFLFIAAYAAIAFNFLRFIDVWMEFQRFLRRISWSPLREACASLGESGARAEKDAQAAEGKPGRTQLPPLSLTSSMPTFTALQFSVEQAEKMVARACDLTSLAAPPATTAGPAPDSTALGKDLTEAKSQLATAFDAHAKGASFEERQALLAIQHSLANIASSTVKTLDTNWWLSQPGSPPQAGAFLEQAKNFLASRILDYSRHVLAQLRNLLNFSTLGFMAMLLAASSYPFLKSDTLLRISWMMLLVVVALGVWIFLEIKRDRILSLLAGETPGQVDWNSAVIGHLALYGLLPLLTIVGVQFPATLQGIVNSVISLLSGSHT